jgi:competence protein ComEC
MSALLRFAAACSLLCLMVPLSSCRPVPKTLRVTFLDVGQGDCTVIESPSGQVAVIDGGGYPASDERLGADPGSRVLVPFLRFRGISRVDALIATHPDEDHAQGLIAPLKRLGARLALDTDSPAPPESAAARLRAELARRKVPVHLPRRGDALDLGAGVRLEVLHPDTARLRGTRSDDNNNALIFRLTYKKARVLLMADAEEEAERALLSSGQELVADILKVGHHGSRGSTSPTFLQRVKPSAAIVSCGRDNRFGHPHNETLARLAAQGIRLFRTDLQGAITLESDGERIALTPFLQ